ncbi:MAG TPA: DUF6067 family protein [Candidatus Brocadiia bacterium]|nr:DUF6067 family protein [Candidatus Brocadiia bacterium]
MELGMSRSAICVAALWSLASMQATSETMLMDFETDADLKAFHYEGRGPDTPVKELASVESFATSGMFSLRFETPAWKAGMAEWPAFEGRPAMTDWTGFERFVFEVTNVTDAPQRLFLFISDSKKATRDGYHEQIHMAPRSYRRVVIHLAQVTAKGVDVGDIRVLHFYTERPSTDMKIHVDRLCLLPAGDDFPAVSDPYLKQFAKLLKPRMDSSRLLLRETGEKLRKAAAASPEIGAWADASLKEIEAEITRIETLAARGDAAVLDGLPGLALLESRLESLVTAAKLRADFAGVRGKVEVKGGARKDVVVGFATSMEKVLPRALTSPLNVARGREISLARNERESFQVVVLPFEGDLKDVRVNVTDLKGEKGARFEKKNIDAVVMGYVKTAQTPPYGSPHVGWWPDPILNFQTTCDVAKGDAQAFWIRLRAPKDQPPGLYRGKIEIEAVGRKMFSFDLAARVYGFAMPDATPLPLAVTFWPMFYEPNETGGYREGEFRDETWKTHKMEWAEFLADYYLSYDSLYSFKSWAPDFEILERLHKEGRLGRFNLGYYSACGQGETETGEWRKATIDVIRPRYEKAKELGLLDHAYIYGCDENPEDRFPFVQRAAELLKAEFPGVLVLTTTYDHSFGTKSVIKAMDGFCPLTPRFDAELAAQARAAGKEVWWYICCGPHHPHANMFVEYPAIEGRLLMGAMTAKLRPDGFLYYEISIWNSPPIESGPFTAWNPRSWTTYNGDGSWTCMGPGATPLPTIRLENFRDGLEDYAYFRILEATVGMVADSRRLSPQKTEWIEKARALLSVPEELVKDTANYSRDPAAVYKYRNSIAEMIEAAGVDPADPWAKR